MVEGPLAGPSLLDGLRLDTHRLHAVRAHLLHEAGETAAAAAAFSLAASLATNARERDYLTLRAVASGRSS